MEFILDLIFNRLAKAFSGYKTALGGYCLILTGIIGIVGHYYPDLGLKGMDLPTAFGSISLGITALGGGHKLEKLTESKCSK